MVLMIIPLAIALLILLLGFLEIKIPFVSGRGRLKNKKQNAPKLSMKIKENLVKDSVDETLKRTKFLKEKRINEDSF